MSSILFVIVMALTSPCQHEDSTNCYWDASSRGNGEGTSFVNLFGVRFITGGAS